MFKIQYAIVPIKYLEISSPPKKKSIKTLIDKIFKPKHIIVKIEYNKNPYIEELITNNKIGLNKSDNYKMYIKGNAIYTKLSKEEAYLKVMQMRNYKDLVKKLFN